MTKIAIILVAITAAVAGLAILLRDDSPPKRQVRLPATSDERARVAVALEFVELAAQGDAARACAISAGEMHRRLDCAGTPKISSLLRGDPVEVYEISGSADSLLTVSVLPAYPVLGVTVDQAGKVVDATNYAEI